MSVSYDPRKIEGDACHGIGDVCFGAGVPRLIVCEFNTAGDAASLMFEHRIRSLSIYQASKLVGQITSRSIVEKLLDSEQGLKASEIMTPRPICLDARDRVSKAREIMIRRRIDQLPILKTDRL
jgi:CBS domain-containing protein